MSKKAADAGVLVVSGDERIRKLLAGETAVVWPAYACRLDGFANDTFTEYADASVYRPGSVCQARLVSAIGDVIHTSGRYYLGFTMYTSAGYDEPIDVWIGHRRVARACIADPDNRVHLFVAPEAFRFRGGEPVRLETSETDGPCRIENLVLLPKLPLAVDPRLEIISPHVDLRYDSGDIHAYVTWVTNRPASGRLEWRRGRASPKTPRITRPAVNHEVVLKGLERGKSCRYEIRMVDRTRGLEAVHEGSFKVEVSPPRSRVRKARVSLPLRRPGPAAGSWPISVGFPFPKGTLGSPQEARLLGEGGEEIPCQVQTLAEWEDGSVRWGLLDFRTDGKAGCTVEYGRDVGRLPPRDPLKVVESRKAVTVTTGPIRMEFSKDRAVFPGVVSVRREDGTYRLITPGDPSPAVSLVGDDGTTYAFAVPEVVELEEHGPGDGETLFSSTFRVHLFRNSGLIRVLHTFENDRTEEEFTPIRELALRADLDVGRGAACRMGGRRVDPDGTKPVVLRQTHDNVYTIWQGRRKLAQGRRTSGSVELAGSDAGVGLAVRDFWQNYPKGLCADAGGVTIQICPPLERGAYPRGGELEDRLYYYLLDGRYRLKYGVSRTHELWFDVWPGGTKGSTNLDAFMQSPPLHSVALDAFNRSRAVTELPSKDASPYPPYEAWVDAAQKAYAKDREAYRSYGMLNYGDWYGERVYNWGNMEYDTPWCFLQEYLRGGDADFFTWAEEAARHLVDVDTCHHHPDPERVGEQYLHCVGHVGGYYPDGYRESAIFSGRWSVSHTWVEGLLLHYFLSGEKRSLEGAMKTCRLMVGRMLNDYDFTNCRNSGWHLIHMSAAYRATGRRVYLNAARIIMDRVLERQRASGGWERLMVPGHCFCDPPRHTGNAGFMVGVLLTGLKRYHEATGDRRVAEAIVRATDYSIDSFWIPKSRSFRYTSCPHSAVGRGADMRLLKALATAYAFSGVERFRKVLLAGVSSAVKERMPGTGRGAGKGISSPMRGAPQVLLGLPHR